MEILLMSIRCGRILKIADKESPGVEEFSERLSICSDENVCILLLMLIESVNKLSAWKNFFLQIKAKSSSIAQ